MQGVLHNYRKCVSQLAYHLVRSLRMSGVTTLRPSYLHGLYGGINTSERNCTPDAVCDCLDSLLIAPFVLVLIVIKEATDCVLVREDW
jgi:hypothetical protein